VVDLEGRKSVASLPFARAGGRGAAVEGIGGGAGFDNKSAPASSKGKKNAFDSLRALSWEGYDDDCARDRGGAEFAGGIERLDVLVGSRGRSQAVSWTSGPSRRRRRILHDIARPVAIGFLSPQRRMHLFGLA